MSDPMTPDKAFAIAAARKATELALAIDSPRALAEHLLDWAKDTYGERITTGYWITVDGTQMRDKGILVDIAQLPWRLRLRAMVGGWSAGLGIWSPEEKLFGDMKVSVGAGAVIDYNLLDKVRPVLGVAIRF